MAERGASPQTRADGGAKGETAGGMFDSGAPKRGLDLKILFPAIILVVLGVVGVWAINRFVDEARERELTQWQVRLGIVADSRVAEVNRWLAGNMADLNALAENESVQLYVGSIDEFSTDPTQQDQVEGFRQYLRNLLLVAATRGGFGEAQDEQQPGFNAPNVASGGILIVNTAGEVVAAVALPGRVELPRAGQQRRDLAMDLHVVRIDGEDLAVEGDRALVSAPLRGALRLIQQAGAIVLALAAEPSHVPPGPPGLA